MLTLSLLVATLSSADNLCKQFGHRRYPTEPSHPDGSFEKHNMFRLRNKKINFYLYTLKCPLPVCRVLRLPKKVSHKILNSGIILNFFFQSFFVFTLQEIKNV